MATVLAFTGLAALLDLWRRWIPNALILLMLLTGFALQGAEAGAAGLLQGGLGLLVGGGLLLPLYLLGGMAAGDVKLMAGVGVFLGPAGALVALVWTLLAGGVLALAILLKRRLTRAGGAVATEGMPYAPAIALGTLVALLPTL